LQGATNRKGQLRIGPGGTRTRLKLGPLLYTGVMPSRAKEGTTHKPNDAIPMGVQSRHGLGGGSWRVGIREIEPCTTLPLKGGTPRRKVCEPQLERWDWRVPSEYWGVSMHSGQPRLHMCRTKTGALDKKAAKTRRSRREGGKDRGRHRSRGGEDITGHYE